MDSLLANYASSDEEEEEEEEEQQQQQEPISPVPSKTTSSFSRSSTSSLFSSLPQPKSSSSSSSSSSLFQSILQPKQPSITSIDDDDDAADAPAPSSSKFAETSGSIFSSLPKPKSQIQQQQQQQPQPQPQPPKKVVQFKPPTFPIPNPTEPDEDEEEERNRRRKMESSIQAPSVKSFLFSIPAPRNSATLGVQSSSGSGRRSIIETEAAPASEPALLSNSGGDSEGGVAVDQNAAGYVNYEGFGGYQYGSDQNAGSGYFADGGGSYGSYGSGFDQSEDLQQERGVPGTGSYGNCEGAAYAGYGGYGDYGQYGNNWGDGSAAAMAVPESSGAGESTVVFPKKRGRNEIPSEIIEVKQDELIKNRPREDQVKLTGLAFGPSYQPVSAKGKPSKLHKRKHQIGSLYFDMKQNEMKLAERRAKGMLTKSETQAKYGW